MKIVECGIKSAAAIQPKETVGLILRNLLTVICSDQWSVVSNAKLKMQNKEMPKAKNNQLFARFKFNHSID
jgi:hypothetical protein